MGDCNLLEWHGNLNLRLGRNSASGGGAAVAIGALQGVSSRPASTFGSDGVVVEISSISVGLLNEHGTRGNKKWTYLSSVISTRPPRLSRLANTRRKREMDLLTRSMLSNQSRRGFVRDEEMSKE
jgi:hypothetical protein